MMSSYGLCISLCLIFRVSYAFFTPAAPTVLRIHGNVVRNNDIPVQHVDHDYISSSKSSSALQAYANNSNSKDYKRNSNRAGAGAGAMNRNNNNGGRETGRTNRDFREKRLQDKMDRQLKKFLSICESDEIPSQASCDNLLAICAASNEWDNYETSVEKMGNKGISIQRNTYDCILKECFTQGNGGAAVRVLNLMQSHSDEMKPNQGDLKLAIGALCRNNNSERGLWKKALQLIHLSAAALEKGEMDMTLHVDAYNEILQCMEGDKRWEDALELLETMEEGSGFHAMPNLATYHRILNVLVSSSQVDAAAELLLSLSKRGKELPTIYSYEIVLSALLDKRQRKVRWKQGIQLLDSMYEVKITATTVMYNRVIAACAKAKNINAARDVFHKMKARKVPADTVTYNSLISAAANTGRHQDALTLFRYCKDGPGVDIITYTNTIRACGRGKMSKIAIELLDDAKENNMPLDAFIYTAAIDACAKNKVWKDALKLLHDMEEHNVLPNEYTYSSAITACGNCGEWKQSLELLDQMKEQSMKISTITYNAAISALSKGARRNIKGDSDIHVDKQNLWIKALGLLDEMKSKRIWPDVYTYSGVLSTCASGGRYKEALDLIKAMQNGPPRNRPNKIAYTGAISACGRSGEWSHALQLFVNMKADQIRCDVVAYNALMSAFANGGKPDMCHQLWNDMCGKGNGEFSIGTEQVSPDIITLTTVISSLEKSGQVDHRENIDVVFANAVERNIIFSNTMDTKWEIDLSGMSLPVARAGCRFVLSQLRDIEDSEQFQNLNFITGIGRHHHQEVSTGTGTTALREYVQEILLQDFNPALSSSIPERAPGVVRVERDTIQNWAFCSKANEISYSHMPNSDDISKV